MSKTPLISGETLKTFGQGALGAITFGAYYQYTSNKMMELNNEKIEIRHKYLENQYKKEMNEMENNNKILNEKLKKLEQIVSSQNEKNSWW